MSNGAANCYLAVCCPPDSEQQKAAFIHEYEEATGEPCKQPETEVLEWVLSNFDLAPKGTLQPFKDAIAKLALSASPAK